MKSATFTSLACLMLSAANVEAIATEVDAQVDMAASAELEHHHHHKHHHDKQNVQVKPAAPAHANLVAAKADPFDAQGASTDVPIDEVRAITLKVNPNYAQDTVESVTLKSFRKVVGYDTFNSILKGGRDEQKDISDHYNVTLTVMVKRNPESTLRGTYVSDTFAGGKTLKDIIDKGFPYDDGDNSIDDQTANWSKKNHRGQTQVGKLNGENVTKSALVNLIKDTDAPITQALVQLDKSDADGLFKLMDANVTRGNLKNLVTDKPAPITVALAQKSDADGLFKLMDANVTRGNLKNLVTDKPAPITVAL